MKRTTWVTIERAEYGSIARIGVAQGGLGLADSGSPATYDVTIRDREGLHARPVMRFVELAMRYQSQIQVRNVTLRGERVDGKSAMQMMLLEATSGSVLRIEAVGDDAGEAVAALGKLIEAGFENKSA